MRAFTQLNGVVVPIDRSNVDTDAIIPKQFLKSIQRSGFGANLFDEWRYLDRGEPGQDCALRARNPDFPLNLPRYTGAQILLARENFGCGSSREHAAWALLDFGIQVLIAASFADIFYNNCFKNGMLPIVLARANVDTLFDAAARTPGFRLTIDLRGQTVMMPGGATLSFEVDPRRKRNLLEGLNDIDLTLNESERIRGYELQRAALEPWLFER
jgi:3-isopropylmalate/(R)-2-methylmalate dehydratase small subunit